VTYGSGMRSSGRRRLVAGLAALLTLGALGGCRVDPEGGTARKLPSPADASAPSPAAEDGPSGFDPTLEDEQAIRDLMAARAAAVEDGDARAFRATVDARQPELVAAQMTLFRNLQALPLDSFRYEVSTIYLTPARVPGRDPVLHPQVLEQLQVTATMTRPVSNKLDVTLVRRGDRWLVGAEREPGAKGSVEEPQERPWLGVPIAVRHEGNLTVLVDAASRDRLAGLVEAVQDGVQRDASILGVEPDQRVLVDATSNGEATGFGAGVTEKAAAVTFPIISAGLDDAGRTEEAEVAGTAIKINPQQVAELLDEDRVLWHELTHYLLFDHVLGSPTWLTEGVAAWSEWQPVRMSGLVVADDLYDRIQRAYRELPGKGVFYGKPDVDYPIAQAAVQWLVDRGGTARLLELMRTYDRLYDGADTDANTGKALRKVYGITEKELVAGTFETVSSLHH